MKWLTWRQYRWELIISAAILVVLAAVLVPIGFEKLALFNSLGLANLHPSVPNFVTLSNQFLDTYHGLDWMDLVVGYLPGIVGGLLAIPIVLEFEQRTYRLAWTQSVTRGRWLAVKLGFALAVAIAFSSLLTTLTSWFRYPQDQLIGPFSSFSTQGIVPIAYTVFTLGVAVAVGTLSRRTAWAVLAGVVLFIVVLLTIDSSGLRSHYMTPVQQVFTETTASPGVIVIGPSMPIPPTAWVLRVYAVDASGHPLAKGNGGPIANSSGPSANTTQNEVVEYQPTDRYWPFQGIESGIFLGMSGFALGVSVWAVKKRFR